ncbi:MAG: IclR family transcriptional regulator [bacterium]|nr:IclR family transcriptional regulator [bacterium]
MSGSPSALYKAFDILEAFSRTKELSAKDLYALLHIPMATQYRILRALQERGYIMQDPQNRRYKLGLKILHLSAAALEHLDIAEVGWEILRSLWEETQETIHLAMLDGVEIVYVQTLESPQPIRLVSRTGARAPAYCVASGKAILAHSSKAHVEEVVLAGFRRFNAKTICTVKDFRSELRKIRARGFAISRGEWREEVSGISAPVFDHRGQVLAAMGISGPTERFTEAQLPVLGKAALLGAAELSKMLGSMSPNSFSGERVDGGALHRKGRNVPAKKAVSTVKK